jgi:TrmH family RNA methyltransferase
MKEFPRAVRVVLVRPRNPLNLLAAARAAVNFGFDDVVVVSPHEPVWDEAMAAEHALSWLGSARRTATLLEAIEDCHWVLGTSCLARRRVASGQRVISLDHLMMEAKRERRGDRVAILFGSEKRGLSKQDLDLCHAIIRIPTSTTIPSMNLGQAVAVCCYELRSWGRKKGAAPPASPLRELPVRQTDMGERSATAGEIDRLVDSLGAVLGIDGRTARATDRQRQIRLRQMLMRLPLRGRDVALILGVLRDLAWRFRSRP